MDIKKLIVTMHWCRGIFFFVLLLLTVVSGEEGEDENAPALEILAKPMIYNVLDKKAIYCKGVNLKERMQWINPANEEVQGRSTKNNRIFVEKVKEEEPGITFLPLIVQSAQINDTGRWICKAGELNETFDMVVADRVYFSVQNDSMEADEGKTVRIRCEAKGYPEISIDWFKHRLHASKFRVREDKRHQFRTYGSDYGLEIKNVNHEDSDDYFCRVVQKDIGHFTWKRIRLSVQHKPLILDTATQTVSYEKVRSEEVFAILNDTKNITCAVLANPPPSYSWFRRKKAYDEPIQPEPDTVFTAENGSYSVLILRIYNTSYLGQYICSAANNKGKVSVVYHVSLGNQPEAPDFISFVNASTDSITFNVSCSKCFIAPKGEPIAPDPKNLPLLGFSFLLTPVLEEYNEGDWESATEIGVDIVDPDDSLFTVGPLPNNTNFYARVRSRNAAGYSAWVDVSGTAATTDLGVSILPSIFVVVFSLMLFFVF